MGDGVFNIAKGRVVELYNRVKSNDPTNSAFVIVLGVGSITDANLRDLDTLAAVTGHADFTEASFTNYARKVLTDSDLAALPSPDDSNDRYDLDLADQVWTSAGGASNNTLTRLLVCYDSDSTGGADSAIIPLTFHDFSVTTNGTDLTAQIASAGFYRAS